MRSSNLLGIPHMVVCVNKMDLVDWDRARFDEIQEEFMAFASRLDIRDVAFIPISALHGDNVVNQSDNAWWYRGRPLLNHLETVYIASDENFIDPRFPVQYVIRSHGSTGVDFRGYAGTVASGVFRPGDPVVIMPSGVATTIDSIETADGAVEEAFPPMAVTMTLADPVGVARGGHDLPAQQPSQHDAGDRGDGELDGCPALPDGGHTPPGQAHDKGGARHGRSAALQDGHQRHPP